ncbi:MAG: hypothetical protein K2Q22_15510 [Cytophagales bacterium]|nr:hypothetical protein [Cytophagales bacterium]
MKNRFTRILSISLLVGLLFTQVAVHFLHNHDEAKNLSGKTVVSSSDSLCLACSVEFTGALFYASFATFLFVCLQILVHAPLAVRHAIHFSTLQIGRAPPALS